MPKLITVLEDNVKYRDGKKWKQRYCILHKPDPKTGNIVMFIMKPIGGTSVPYQCVDDKISRQYIKDEITGFEYGRHIDREGSVMALIGRNVVYCIAFSQNETMFRWAETLNKYFKSANFHVTLKKVSETSGLFNKIPAGIQGNLHVQSMRLCLIGEPADGNKFICEWPIGNIVSIDIFNTDCDKVKEIVIRSNGKLQRIKGNFEFEINLTQNSLFQESFETFLRSCKIANEDFRTNFANRKDLVDGSQDNTSFSYSILSKDINYSNSDNSSSLEKRSSEIPIPRSREHSGPDQRPIDNVQIKIRKSSKHHFVKKMNDNKKHLSLIDVGNRFDNDACLFDDDEEIAGQADDKNRIHNNNLLCNGLSQESSGVYVNGASSSTRDMNLSARIFIQDDSGCGDLSSTSSTQNDVPHVLPPSQKRCHHKDNILTFYHNIVRNPLLLANYTKYNQLLKAVSDNHSQIMKRSNSFNCVHLSDRINVPYSRKYSHSNFPLSLNYQVSDRHFNHWRKRIADRITENVSDISYSKHSDPGDQSISTRLPFRSTKDFHHSIVKSIQNGTACLHLFCYHHFLMLLNDLKLIIRNLESSQKPADNADDGLKSGDKQSIYNRWLEKIQSEYCKSFDVDSRSKKASILDINLILIYEIANSIFHAKKLYSMGNGSCDCIPRHNSYYMTNPTIELNNDKCLLKRVDEDIFKQSFNQQQPLHLTTGLVMCTSSSTPDFSYYNQPNATAKLSTADNTNKYQNLSPLDTFDTMNHTFPKQNVSLNKSDSSDNKGGSFKKFRRKYSPGFLIPFLHLGSSKFSNTMFTRRKTPSTHSTLSEPICHMEHKDQNNYYNINHQRKPFTKRSLSVVLDSSFPYEESKECHSYINVQNNKGMLFKPDMDSNNYMLSGSSSMIDDNSYPEEILDPSRNYGNLHFIKSTSSKLKFLRQDSENHNIPNFRRSSLSILSNRSLQNYFSSRPTSLKKHHAYSNMNPSDVSSNNSDYVNGNVAMTSGSSPQSIQSCSPALVMSPYQRTVPRSLNYVTVMENNQYTGGGPLSICAASEIGGGTESDVDYCSAVNSRRSKPANFKSRHSRLTPQSSPVVDYCQIDFTCTYALKEVDLILGQMQSSRDDAMMDLSSSTCNCDHQQSMDSYSLASSSACPVGSGKDHHHRKHQQQHKSQSMNKRYFRKFFSRKHTSTAGSAAAATTD